MAGGTVTDTGRRIGRVDASTCRSDPKSTPKSLPMRANPTSSYEAKPSAEPTILPKGEASRVAKRTSSQATGGERRAVRLMPRGTSSAKRSVFTSKASPPVKMWRSFTGREANLFTSDRRGTKSRAAYAARHKFREAERLHKQGFAASEDVKKSLRLLSEERLMPREEKPCGFAPSQTSRRPRNFRCEIQHAWQRSKQPNVPKHLVCRSTGIAA